MPTPYFSKFPQTTYDVTGTGTQSVLVADILHRAQFLKVLKSNPYIFYPYTVQEGETPEIIASKLYGSPLYFWIVMFANDIYNLWTEWPLNYENFLAYIISTYGSIATAQTTVHHYEDAFGNWIDLDTYTANVSNGAIRVYAYDYEATLNAAKAQIQLVDPQYVAIIDSELDNLLTPTNT